jgi:hypothetical protein
LETISIFQAYYRGVPRQGFVKLICGIDISHFARAWLLCALRRNSLNHGLRLGPSVRLLSRQPAGLASPWDGSAHNGRADLPVLSWRCSPGIKQYLHHHPYRRLFNQMARLC